MEVVSEMVMMRKREEERWDFVDYLRTVGQGNSLW